MHSYMKSQYHNIKEFLICKLKFGVEDKWSNLNCLFVSQRFTGNQIAKIFQQKRENYEDTEVCCSFYWRKGLEHIRPFFEFDTHPHHHPSTPSHPHTHIHTHTHTEDISG